MLSAGQDAADADSNLVQRFTREGQPIFYAYDGLNRLCTKVSSATAVACGGTVSSDYTVSYSYDLAGRLKGVSDTSPAIASVAMPSSTVTYAMTYSYDALNRPQGVSFGQVAAATAPGTASSVLFGHSYNKANQRVGQTVSDNSWLNYPPGSASTTAYTANNMNQYTAVGGVTPTYDSNGNLLFDGTYNLGYDRENRLVSMGTTGSSAAYSFDSRGRRKQKAVNLVPVVSVTDADNREVLEYDGSTGALLRWYAYGLGPNDVLGQMNVPAGTRLALVRDIQGSIIATMDAATATLTPFAYRPYGSATSTPVAFGYTGQRIDQETSLYYYRARHYHPGWGRFAQSDPVGYDAGPNLYSYVLNNPLNAIDPEGLDTQLGVGATFTTALMPLGLSGGFLFGINVPDNPLNWRGYQVFVQPQANAMLGVGAFVGIGLNLGYSRTDGPLPVVSGSVNRYFEFDAGAGAALNLGIQIQPSGSEPRSVPDMSLGFPGLPGGGLGLWVGAGYSASGTVATPTFGTMVDSVSSLFGSGGNATLGTSSRLK